MTHIQREKKSNRYKLTSSGPIFCFGHKKTSRHYILKEKRNWCLKIKGKVMTLTLQIRYLYKEYQLQKGSKWKFQ